MNKLILSSFKQIPKTKTGKWAMGLSFVSILSGPIMGIVAAVIVPFVDDTNWGDKAGQIVGFSFMIAMAITLIATLILSVRAYLIGERSWGVWFALALSGLSVLFWTMMIVGEFASPH